MIIKTIREAFARRFDQAYYSAAVSVAASMCNNETFSEYKCCNKEGEVVLCGAGPTLAKYVPIEGAKHIALNRALLNEKIHYDYFVADDWDGIKNFTEQLKSYDCVKFFGHQIGCDYIRQIPESFRIDAGAKRYYTDSYMLGGLKSRFVCDIDKMAIGNFTNIALSAMQIVLFMRPKRIYLAGCDASSAGHFVDYNNYTNTQEKRIQADLKNCVASDQVIECWKELKRFAEAFYPDIEIISVNPVGLKGIFTDVYQDENQNTLG